MAHPTKNLFNEKCEGSRTTEKTKPEKKTGKKNSPEKWRLGEKVNTTKRGKDKESKNFFFFVFKRQNPWQTKRTVTSLRGPNE
jgi:hypothetical protein